MRFSCQDTNVRWELARNDTPCRSRELRTSNLNDRVVPAGDCYRGDQIVARRHFKTIANPTRKRGMFLELLRYSPLLARRVSRCRATGVLKLLLVNHFYPLVILFHTSTTVKTVSRWDRLRKRIDRGRQRVPRLTP